MRSENGGFEGSATVKNNAKKWLAFRLKISSSGSPTYTVQGGAAILKPNTQKKIRIFAEEGQFSETDEAFRDDPVQTENMSFEKDDSEDFVCGLDSNDIQTCPCSCGNCAEMPSKEEQVCCKSLAGWQKEYKSKGAKYF